ncbi:MAG: hypothetical protein K6F46_07705 [Desulfovibrio sp.]|nr:hypothetical protein [Desulfovibrio sp.]
MLFHALWKRPAFSALRRRMGLACLLLSAVLLAFGNAWAALPKTYKEFKARYQTEARTPEGALKLHFEAIFCYINPATRDEASKMLRYSLYLPRPLEQSRTNATFVERMTDPDYNFVFRSFVKGATPENNYSMSPDSFTLNMVRKWNSEGFLKINLRSSGADSPRCVWMLKHDGLWYTNNNAGLYSMVREPRNMLDARKNLHDADYDAGGAHAAPQDDPRSATPLPDLAAPAGEYRQ